MALQCTSGNMQGTCANNTTTSDVYDTWEIGYNHFHTRMKQDMPNTWLMLTSKVRTYQSNPGSWNIFYETLTHADISYSTSASIFNQVRQISTFVTLQFDGICEIHSAQTAPMKSLLLH